MNIRLAKMLKLEFFGFSEKSLLLTKQIFAEHLKAGVLYYGDLKHMASGQNRLTRVLSNEKSASVASLANLVPLSYSLNL